MTHTFAPDPREAKLPRWAQDQLQHLRRELDRARNVAETARDTDLDGSDTVLESRTLGTIGLGTGPTVTFRLPPTWSGPTPSQAVTQIRVRIEGCRLYVASDTYPIDVRPAAPNALTVGAAPRAT